MRRRNKPRVVWLPPTNANSLSSDNRSGFQTFRVDVTPAAPLAVGEIPLTIDAQSNPLAADTSLADVESAGYRLRRIVGKIWVLVDQDAMSNVFRVCVTAGIIIRRVDPETGLSFATQTGALAVENVSPEQIVNYGDPWAWRRSWFLGNNASGNADPLEPNLPASNQFFAALDGPHVDQKTARVVAAEERLFLDVCVRSIEEDDQDNIALSTLIITDLRVLASMRTSSGNRRNASR